MIGWLRFRLDGEEQVLRLDDDHSIRCTDEGVRAFAESQLELHKVEYSPADGPFGAKFLNDLAEELDGVVHLRLKGTPEGTVN